MSGMAGQSQHGDYGGKRAEAIRVRWACGIRALVNGRSRLGVKAEKDACILVLSCCWQMKWGRAGQARPAMMMSYCRTSSAWLLTWHTSGRLVSSPCLAVGEGATQSRGWRPPAPFTCLVPQE